MENQNYDHKQNPFWHTIYWNPLFKQAKQSDTKRGFPYLHRYVLSDPNSPYVLDVEGPATLIIESARLTFRRSVEYNMGRLLVHKKAWTNLLPFYDEVNEVNDFDELEAIAVEQEEQKLWKL